MRSDFSLKLLPQFFSQICGSSVDAQHRDWTRPHGNTQLFITFPVIVVLQWFLALLHTPYVLPRVGVQTFVYVGFMISLGVFFAGLSVWEGIV